MTLLAPLVMLGWIPATLALFRFLPTRRALIAAFIAGWLFLPNVEFEINGWPNYNKLAAICVVALAAVLIFDRTPLLRLRPALVDAPAAFFCISPILSSLAAGLGVREALSIFFWQAVAWGIPFLLGRAYLGDAAGLRALAKGIVAGGLLYIPLCIFEFFADRDVPRLENESRSHRAFGTMEITPMQPPIFIQIDENPNCAAMDGQVFQPKAPARAVKRVRVSRDGVTDWFDITGLDEAGAPFPASASPIDDSGDGACYLVTGGAWGLRLTAGCVEFGEPYLVLGGDGHDLEFL